MTWTQMSGRRQQHCSIVVLTWLLVLLFYSSIEPIQAAGGGRGIAVTAKGGKGKNVVRPYDPNESNGSWSVALVVVLPVAQMFFMVALCLGIHHCYTKYCLKVLCCRKKRGGPQKRCRISKLNSNDEATDCAVPMTELSSELWTTATASRPVNGTRPLTYPVNGSIPTDSTSVILQPPEGFQNPPPAPKPRAPCPVHSTTRPTSTLRPPSANGYLPNSTRTGCFSPPPRPRTKNTHQVTCQVHGNSTPRLLNKLTPPSRRVYPTTVSGQHRPLIRSNAITGTPPDTPPPPAIINGTRSGHLSSPSDQLELQCDVSLSPVEDDDEVQPVQSFYTHHVRPCLQTPPPLPPRLDLRLPRPYSANCYPAHQQHQLECLELRRFLNSN